MNKIILKGVIRNLSYSHTINEVEYDKADLITSLKDGKEDIISLRFKKFSNPGYKDGDEVYLVGNIRSYSEKISGDKNKVSLYVFTYFDIPEVDEAGEEIINKFELDGRICKIDELRVTDSGKHNLHFILANNIISKNQNQKLNNYLPSCVWGKLAIECSDLKVSDKVSVKGQLHSRTYRKVLDNGEIEFRTAHELLIEELTRID